MFDVKTAKDCTDFRKPWGYMKDSPLSHAKFWLPDEIQDFDHIARYVKFKEKTTLFWAGDESDNAYFITSGYVKMFHLTSSGDTITLLVHKPGDILGIGGVLEDTVYEVSAETVGPSEMWVISREVFLDMMFKYPKFAVWVATSLASRMKRIDQMLLHLVSLSAERRLALTLLDFAVESVDPNDAATAYVRATHQDIANLIGNCRQTTTVILDRFRDEGIINIKKGRIDIYSLDRLREIADGPGSF
jgi:CRP/FNR family transcriptional regulator